MRILTRAEFLALPAGVLYRKGTPWSFGPLNVKHDSTGNNDWHTQELLDVDSTGSDQLFLRYDEMLGEGTSYPCDDAMMRDGCFGKDDLFLVLEPDDAKYLLDLVLEAMKIEIPKRTS